MKKEQEFERAQTRSLLMIAATFVFANMFLIIGFTQIAAAQSLGSAQPVLDLAKMLAAPELTTSFDLSVSRGAIFGVMSLALVVMSVSSAKFFRDAAGNVSQATRNKL